MELLTEIETVFPSNIIIFWLEPGIKPTPLNKRSSRLQYKMPALPIALRWPYQVVVII